MDLMEQLLCPQVCMDVDDTPLEIQAPTDGPDGPVEAEISSLPIELRIRLILDNEFKFQPEQIPHELQPSEMFVMSETFSEVDYLKSAKLNCTVCNRHIGTSLVEQVARYVHPELNTLMCHPCFKFYGSGEFEKDEDGSEIYCKWCGQGGNVVCCSDCSFVFCLNCVKRNLGVHGLMKIKNLDNWSCFRCDPKQLTKFRLACFVLHQYSVKQLSVAVRTKNMFLVKDDFSTCCNRRKRRKSAVSDDENDEFRPDKQEKSRAKGKKSMTLLNKESLKTAPAAKPRALATHNTTMQNINFSVGGATYQTMQPQATFMGTVAPQPLIKFNVAPIANPTPAVNATPSLAELLPSIFTTLGAPAISAGNLQIQNPSTNPVRVSLAPANVNPGATPCLTKKTYWLLNAINACKFHAQTLVTQVDDVQQRLRESSTGQELAELHNSLQREMTACSNRLTLCRKNMHKEFLRYLKMNNISHTSHQTTQGTSTTGRRGFAAKSTTPRMPRPQLRGISATQRPVVTAAIDLCDDDDDDDCMVNDMNGAINGGGDPLGLSDDEVELHNFEPTVILETSDSETETQQTPTKKQVDSETKKMPENTSPLSDKAFKRACNVKVVLDRDMSMDSTKYLTKNKVNRTLPDLVRDNDDVLSSLELVGIAARSESVDVVDNPQEDESTTSVEGENKTEEDSEAPSSSGFDFVREMQNEMTLSNSLLGVDISTPSTPSMDVPPSICKTDTKKDDKVEMDMAEVHVLEAIKQLTETIAQNIDSNDNVSNSDDVSEEKVADASNVDMVADVADMVSDVTNTVADFANMVEEVTNARATNINMVSNATNTDIVADTNKIPEKATDELDEVASVTPTIEMQPAKPEISKNENFDNIQENMKSLEELPEKIDGNDSTDFNDPTPPAICLEDMVKIYEACDTTIDGDMVPPDE